ncbi:MAG: Electron transport protein SCO1/SenC [Proteobacteria bacterium]|nr:Electron transport protein SCO1/SenC [Pseudomonadota bacterium]
MWRAIFLAVLLGLAGCREPPAVFRTTDISGAQFGRSLGGMTDHRGQARALPDFQGKATLLFFGYLSCPDVCPTTLARFSEAMKRLGPGADKVQVLLITVDPERDTAEKLGAYVTGFHPSFIGLRADLPATEAVAKEFKVFFSRRKGSEPDEHAHNQPHAQSAGSYMLDHSTGTYVFDPAGRIRLYIKDDASVEDIVSDLKLLIAGK